MSENAPTCLNCGATLVGRFCSACGQRALPPHPTVAELAGDAWNELSGYDGRIAATFRGLLKPGLLTRSYVEGRRASYLSPVRVYLFVSVVYFLVAASAPSQDAQGNNLSSGIRAGVTNTNANAMVTPEEREQLLKELESSPWVLRPMMRAVATDPDGFRARLFTVMPRVFFGLLPIFAAIVYLFYRRGNFATAMVFAVHLHAFAFVVATFVEASKFARSQALALSVADVAIVVFAVYAVLAFRAVFGGRVSITLARMAGISVLYLLASIPAFFIILIWAGAA
jgi:hypothetical protein